MSNQLQITGGAKVRSLEGVITGTSGVLSSLPINTSNGIPQLDVNGKILVSQLPNSVMEYKGTWSAATNTPTLADGTGNQGDVYLCNVAGTVNFGSGPIQFYVGDQVIYSGTIWQRASGASGTVTSVGLASTAGAFTITNSPITTSGNIGLNFSGNSGQYVAGDGSLVTFPSIISEAQNLVTEVYNSTGATIAKGSVVYINGGQGNLPTITKAQANTEVASNQTIGLVRADITNMNNGYVTVAGRLENLDTQAYSVGTTLYLSPSVAGGYTSTKPTSPDHIVYVGVIVRSHPTQGVIEVKIQNTQELSESADVLISSPANNEGLFYESSTSLWKNKTIANVLGYTPANAALVVPYTGATGNVNLGTNEITASNFVAETSFSAKHLTSGTPFRNGYTTFSASADAYSITQAISAGNLKSVIYDLSNLVNNTSYTYGLPAASGTFALLESTQTFTGSKTFSATTALNSVYIDGYSYLKHQVTSGGGIAGYTILDAKANGVIEYIFPTLFKSVLDFNDGADYTYTFPAASGTVALTSNLSSYVPYTGATNNLDLGTYNFTTTGSSNAQFFYANGNAGTGAGQLAMKWGSGFSTPVGYSTIGGITNGFYFITNIAGNNKAAFFDFSGLTTSTQRNYTFPDISGTLLTGSGTSNRIPKFNGSYALGDSSIYENAVGYISINNTNSTYNFDVTGTGRFSSALYLDGVSYLKEQTTTSSISGYTTFSAKASGVIEYYFSTGYKAVLNFYQDLDFTYAFPALSGTIALTSDLNGYVTLDTTQTISGTKTFTNTVTATTGTTGATIKLGGFTDYGTIQDANNVRRIWFENTGSYRTIFDLPSSGTSFVFRTNAGTILTSISSTGAATFSSSVTAGDLISTSYGTARINVTSTTNSANVAYTLTAKNSSGTSNTAGLYYISGTTAANTYLSLSADNANYQLNLLSNGNVGIGTTSPSYTLDINGQLGVNGGSSTPFIIFRNYTSGAVTLQQFVQNGVGTIGTITYNGSNVLYNGTSDYRLKQDLKDYNGLDIINSIKTYDYEWKSNKTRAFGVLAHELSEIIPSIVSGQKDAVDEDGNILPQGVDYSKLVPVLVKAIQEQQKQIEELKAKIN